MMLPYIDRTPQVNLLATDTSTLRAAIALQRDDGARTTAPVESGRRHGRELVPLIRDLLARAGLRAADLGAIGVGLGPGSYTGLRVGVTAAKTLAYATGATLYGLDSLAFFARSASVEATRVTVVSDAQRGDLHVADFGREGGGGPLTRLGPTRIESRAVALAGWTDPLTVVGPGLEAWDAEWPPHIVVHKDVAPDPEILLGLLSEAILGGESSDPWFLEPIYLRRSAAEDQWERRR